MNRVLIFTGEGKGKTTAALGMVLRAAGHGQRVLVVQFIKANSKTGELEACRRLAGVEIAQMGRGFLPPKESPRFDGHREAALEAFDFAAQALASGRFDLIVLDEICTAVGKQVLEEQKVVDLLQADSVSSAERRAPGAGPSCIVLTGRGATPRLVEMADTVTEMKCVRHGYQRGIRAQAGVEY